MYFRNFWRHLFTTAHSRTLERELARERGDNCRLRAENRALLNSILGIAGIPPITVVAPEEVPMKDSGSANAPRASVPSALTAAPRDSFPSLTRPDKPANEKPESVLSTHGPRLAGPLRSARRSGTQHNAPPPRRRSWQQINRMLELESARKKPQEI